MGWPKISRLNREVIVTEKIDGTNACVIIGEDCTVAAQSRTRIITPEDDNFGFAAWVRDHSEELKQLGPGHHFGEWWGRGIQRTYGRTWRRFSLFNTERWTHERPACCAVVPVICRGIGFGCVEEALEVISYGSIAAPGFLSPEGIVAFHVASLKCFKVTLDNDGQPKGAL